MKNGRKGKSIASSRQELSSDALRVEKSHPGEIQTIQSLRKKRTNLNRFRDSQNSLRFLKWVE